MDLRDKLEDFLYTSSNTLIISSNQIHIVNEQAFKDSQFKPICQQSVAYVVGVVLLNEKNEICLIQEAKKKCRGLWYLPCSRVESDEILVDVAVSETLRKSGFKIEPIALCCVEIDQSACWYRFTFLAKIVGGSLKTKNQADNESLQAGWFSLDALCHNTNRIIGDNDETPIRFRMQDFKELVDIAVCHYNKLDLNSFSSSSSKSSHRNEIPFSIMPSQIFLHDQILFTYVIVNEELTHFLVYEQPSSNKISKLAFSVDFKLPSVAMAPSLYWKANKQHTFDFVIESVLLSACFDTNQLKCLPKMLGVLAVDYKSDKDWPDGIQIVFLLTLDCHRRHVGKISSCYSCKKPNSQDNESISKDVLHKPRSPYVWYRFSDLQLAKASRTLEEVNSFEQRLRNRLQRPYEFVALNLK